MQRVLRENKIRFQTPFPAKFFVFYEGETRLYNSLPKTWCPLLARGYPSELGLSSKKVIVDMTSGLEVFCVVLVFGSTYSSKSWFVVAHGVETWMIHNTL